MKSTFKKIVIPFIILHLVGDMVNKAGSYINTDKVNIPSSDSPYVIPNVGGKLNGASLPFKNDMEWSKISGHKPDVS
ncbi:MAG TPA: hypothetical protein VK590_06220 [Saprospiraceae bacterium]|nr:hypothetical protein [Saprospiraceae bacterium]